MEISTLQKRIITKWHLTLGKKLRFQYPIGDEKYTIVEANVLSMVFSPGVVVVGIHAVINYATQQKLESLLFTETDVLFGPSYEQAVKFV